MRFINLFLAGYVILIAGIALALWKMKVLQHMGAVWIVVGVLVAIGIGVMMSVSSGKPTIT